MRARIKEKFENLKEKYIQAGKSAAWITSWERGFCHPNFGGHDAKQTRKPNPKRSSDTDNLRMDQSSGAGEDNGHRGSGRQGKLPSASKVRAAKGVSKVVCPCKLY